MGPRGRDEYVIAQISDIHCGDGRFDSHMLERVIERVNRARPDAVMVVGDLTTNGYPDELEVARAYLGRIECPEMLVTPGNHDSRNVGYVHYKALFGERFISRELPFGVPAESGVQERLRVVAADASIPDLNDGEIGREHYRWMREQLQTDTDDFKVFVVHHHLVSIPGTGRERNIVWDAGDVLDILDDADVDLVLSGHKHVPYVWTVGGMVLVTSGTVSTWRTRGLTPPSHNVVRIAKDVIRVEVRHSADEGGTIFEFPRKLAPGVRERTRRRFEEVPDPHLVGVGPQG